MTKYDNLKDFFQHEHIKLIQSAIYNHMNDGRQISNPNVRSLVCTDDDEFSAEFEIGVSVDVIDSEKSVSLSFIVTARGNFENRFKDIQIKNVRNNSSNIFPEDNLLSQFILPDIPENLVEKIGNDLYLHYDEQRFFEDYKISIQSLSNRGMLYYSELPNNCLGRIILTDSNVDIIADYENPNKKTIQAKCYTILLNYKTYAEELNGTLRVTIAHELVHLLFHIRFLKILTILGGDHYDLKSTTDIPTFKDNMTDVQKALYIAEWQADVLAMRLAIPSITVERVIHEIELDPSTHYANAGDRLQASAIKFAKKYGVSCYVAKERLLQLGFNFVDGIFIEFDGKQNKPFYFKKDTLKDNETFVIDRKNYEQLLSENKTFAELIEARYYVYTGYVVCINKAKYIKPIMSSEGLSFCLSDYAREHAEECCIKFSRNVSNPTTINSEFHGKNYLCKLYDKYYSENGKLTKYATNDLIAYRTMEKEKKEAQKIIFEMGEKNIITFSAALKYHMKRNNLSPKDMADETYLKSDTLKSYLNGKREPQIKNAMIICNKLNLHYDVAIDLLKKTRITLNQDIKEDQLYDYLLTITDASLEEWDLFLKEENLTPFGEYE